MQKPDPPGRRSRPGSGSGLSVDVADDDRSLTPPKSDAARLTLPVNSDDSTGRWAAQIISEARAAGPLARYGTPAFHADVRTCPARALASVLVFAEAWRDHCSPERVAEDMRRQLADEDAATWQRIRSTSADVCEARDWRVASLRPSFRELQERRAS